VIVAALEESGKVAIAKVVLSGRERLVAISPRDGGLLLTTLRTGKEVRDTSYALEPIEADVSEDMLAMARQIIDQKSMEFDPVEFSDGYEEALMDLVKAKIAGEAPVVSKAPERGMW